ncbi:MAG: hypothetical protein ACOZCO_18195 [Bacteroidota bacterium]
MIIELKNFFRQLQQTLETCLRLVLFIKWKKTITAQKEETIIVLGNGPSLNNSVESLGERIHQHKLICVNYFPATSAYEQLKPSYFITSAPELWLNDVDEWYINFRNELFNGMAQKTAWPLDLFIPWEARKNKYWQEIVGKNNNITIRYYNVHPVEGFRGFRHFLFNKQFGLPRPHNVLGPAAMMGIHMGFKKIILLGAEHSWLPMITVDNSNNVLINNQHFYDAATSKPDTMRKSGKGQRKLHEVLHKYMLTFESYFFIREYADIKNVKIYNATPNSFVDAFERISREELNNIIK